MLVTLIILLTGTLSSAYIGSGLGEKSIMMSGVLVKISILSEFPNVLSGVRCVDLCLQNEACMSVFYRRQHRRCQLHDVLFISPQDGEEEADTVYYSVRTDICPPGFLHNRHLNICYQLHLDRRNADDALADCTSRGQHLVVIDNEDKQNHVVKQMKSSSGTRSCSYIIDGSDAAKRGHWVFHDGRNMTFLPWAPGFPETGRGKSHIIARRDSFLWRNLQGDDKCYICERDV
ncbi:uncharacterized protein [Haliotis asinina]|uniref:uncharacterized protein n=1 Tax=Haliotis asinina TaxID=109174 RepID=UPI0035326383